MYTSKCFFFYIFVKIICFENRFFNRYLLTIIFYLIKIDCFFISQQIVQILIYLTKKKPSFDEASILNLFVTNLKQRH